MRKIILTLLLVISFNCELVFSFYSSTTFIDFLVHSNQLRVRTDRMGVLAGPKNIRAAVGLTGADILSDIILENINNAILPKNSVIRFVPSVLGAIGYKSDLFGIGAGYEFTYKNDSYMAHTPVITVTALNDSFRINIPVSIGIGYKSKSAETDLRGTRVISTAIEGRYYFDNVPALSHLRFYINYGNSYIENVTNKNQYFDQQSAGFQFRIYFKVETPNVLIEPIIRVQYDKSLETKYKLGEGINTASIFDSFNITAKDFNPYWPIVGPGSSAGAHGNPSTGAGLQGGYVASIPAGYYAIMPYRVGVALPVGFTAVSKDENIRLYLEPALSFTMINAKEIYTSSAKTDRRKTPFYTFGYVVYGELYIRPVPELEWYLELQTGGVTIAETMKSLSSTSLVINAATGLTWYF